jgi:uncharacterized protein YjiS (DUF1127 family)
MSCNKATSATASFHVSLPKGTDWPWPDWFRQLAPSVTRVWKKSRERQRLMELDDRLLKDIGITREQAELEAAKWPWQ